MNVFQLHQDYNQNLHSPIENQTTVLNSLLDVYNLKEYHSFRSFFDLSTYEDLSHNAFCNRVKHCAYYVRTSGTSSSAKSIPIGLNYLRRNHQRASEYMLYNLVMNHKCVNLLMGKNLALTGYKYRDVMDGKEVFDISSLMFECRPKIYQSIGYPKEVFYNWKDKLDYFKQNMHVLKKIRSLSGVPTWMISLFKFLENEFQMPVHKLFPHLQYIVHGGVKFDNYFSIFRNTFPDRELRFFEVFNSTEAFHGFQLNEDSRDLLLCTNTGVFYEFLSKDKVVPIWELEKNKSYEIVITNEDGLVRYKTGDLISFSNLDPFLFRFQGRVSEFINAFGEDLEVSQTDRVIADLNAQLGLDVNEYLVFPKYSEVDELGCHEWVLFLNKQYFNANKIAQHIDEKLQEINNNYRQKRTDSLAILQPKIHLFPLESFQALIAKQKKASMGQAKIKRLYNDRKIMALIEELSLG